MDRRSTDQRPWKALAANLSDLKVLLAAVGMFAALIIAVYTAKHDLATLKEDSALGKLDRSSMSSRIDAEHVRINTIYDLILSQARLTCRKFPDEAGAAGFPCANLTLKLPEK